jgi:hypothetical protein
MFLSKVNGILQMQQFAGAHTILVPPDSAMASHSLKTTSEQFSNEVLS